MARVDPLSTQQDVVSGFEVDLDAAGFAHARSIGQGGFGVVYRCYQQALDRTVAIKVLTADLEEGNLERFIREQLAMGKLSGHPHIVSVYEVGATPNGRPYIVMQYHPHGSLDGLIHESGPVGWKDTLRIGVKIAGALETAHRRGMLHRDVKPANILLTEYGEPQLTDFGIARISGGFETSGGAITGSPAFTAPEVLEGRTPTAVSDVYSLASALFCIGTGHAVFERRHGEQVVAQFLRITKQPTPDLRDSGLPGDVCAVLEQAMSRQPEDRPATVAEFGELLRNVQANHHFPVDEMPIPIPPTEVSGGRVPQATTGSLRSGSSGAYAARSITPPAPATRFRPPTPPRSQVKRARLIDHLESGRARRLTVIHAPTGFGKSTLAAQWCEELSDKGVAIAWLTVDEDDNNVVWFLSHLIEAIRAVRPSLARELSEVLEEHGDESERYVLTSLINEIHASMEELVVVIDDWHRIRPGSTVGAMAYLLDNLCPGLRLVVTSRSQTGLPMSKMRMRDELVEIDLTHLRFDADESEEFLVDRGGLDLDRTDVEELTESTEGWVAALQLASLSLRASGDPTELIGHLTGRHHAISDFLAENVLDTLEPRMLDFLLSTSISERLCGDLASALAGVPDGRRMLEEIEQRDLFLRRMDDGVWFRYHHLFADFLGQRLERDHADRVGDLHLVAARWFSDHHQVSDAVDHALAAGDKKLAAEIVERDGTYLLEHSQMATLIGLVGKLPREMVDTHPRLQLGLAWANILLHRADAAKRALQLTESTLDGSDMTVDESDHVRIEIGVLRSVIALRADGLAGIHDLVAPCLERADRLPTWVVSVAANVATFEAAYKHDLDEARRLQEWAAPFFRQNKGTYNQIHGLCFLGLAASLQLDIVFAEKCFRQALKIARKSGGSHSYTARLAGSLLGELLYERGEITEAGRLLDEGYKLGPEGGSVDFKIARYVVGARIKALQGDRASAVRRLNEGGRIAKSMSLPRLRAEIENERIRLGFPPHPDYGALPVVRYGERRSPTDEIDAITVMYQEFTAVRLLIADGEVELARTWAQEWVDWGERENRPRELLKARRMLIAALGAAGRTEEAKRLLAGVCALCAEAGSYRYVLDGGPLVVELLRSLREDQIAERWDPEWPDVPESFLTAILNADAVQVI